MKDKCPYCSTQMLYIRYTKPHFGLYCSKCNSWITWLSKEDLKQYLVLPNIQLHLSDVEYNMMMDRIKSEPR